MINFKTCRMKSGRRLSVTGLVFFIVGTSFLGSCSSAPRETMNVYRQVTLSPKHSVTPYFIISAPNGDLIVAGADDVANHRAWATRLTKTGDPIWEFLDGAAGGWTDYSQNGQSFYGAVGLSNGNTLLCGIKRVDTKIVAFLVRIGALGNLIDERILKPNHDGFPLEIRCARWGDGVAIISNVAAVPRGTGWITKLDAAGDFLWEKFGNQFLALGVMPSRAGMLYLIGGHAVVKLDGEGNLLARRALPGSEQVFIQSIAPSETIRIAAMLSTTDTIILEGHPDLVWVKVDHFSIKS